MTKPKLIVPKHIWDNKKAEKEKKEQQKRLRTSGFEKAFDEYDKQAYMDAVKLGQGQDYLRNAGIYDPEDMKYFEDMIDTERLGMIKEEHTMGQRSLGQSTASGSAQIGQSLDMATIATGGLEGGGGSAKFQARSAKKSLWAEHTSQKKALEMSRKGAELDIQDEAAGSFYQTLDDLEQGVKG